MVGPNPVSGLEVASPEDDGLQIGIFCVDVFGQLEVRHASEQAAEQKPFLKIQ